MLIIRLKISQSYFLIQVHHLHIQTRVANDFRNGSTFLGLPEGQNMVTLYGGTSVKNKFNIHAYVHLFIESGQGSLFLLSCTISVTKYYQLKLF